MRQRLRTGRLVIYRLMVAIALVMLIPVCGLTVAFFDYVYGVSFKLSDVEEFIETELPPDATQVQFSTRAGIDRTVWLRFQTSEINARQFINRIAPDRSLESEGVVYFNSPDIDWWQPTQDESYRSVNISNWEQNRFYNIVLVDSDSGNVTMYVQTNDS